MAFLCVFFAFDLHFLSLLIHILTLYYITHERLSHSLI